MVTLFSFKTQKETLAIQWNSKLGDLNVVVDEECVISSSGYTLSEAINNLQYRIVRTMSGFPMHFSPIIQWIFYANQLSSFNYEELSFWFPGAEVTIINGEIRWILNDKWLESLARRTHVNYQDILNGNGVEPVLSWIYPSSNDSPIPSKMIMIMRPRYLASDRERIMRLLLKVT